MKKIAGGLLVAFSLIGCGEEVHTVEWYKEHREECDKKLKECENNPGEMHHTPNCVNARKAFVNRGFSFSMDK